jgi:undecaprenyl diphosphate synthase
MAISPTAPPSVAIIPDGNRRYARKRGITLEAAYLAGFRKSEEAAKWCADAGVKSLTFWALSLDNFSKRSEEEMKLLFGLMKRHARESFRSKVFRDYDFTVRFFGRRDMIPRKLDAMFQKIEEKFRGDGSLRVNFGIAYNGREELLHAAKALASDISARRVDGSALTESDFEKYLYVRESPDLVIRTGNAPRLSGLMPWQTVYSELYFSPKLWPEFAKADFARATEFYGRTERKFGK